MKCPTCGFSGNGDQARFCSKCGMSLVMGVPANSTRFSAQKIACPKCGTDNALGSQLCRSCGQKLEAAPSIPVVDEEPYVTCPSCWHHNPVGTLFCKSCGTRLDNTDLKPTVAPPTEAPPTMVVTGNGHRTTADAMPVPLPRPTAMELGVTSQVRTGLDPGKYVIAIALVLILALAGGFGVYYWWQLGRPVAPIQPQLPVTMVQPAPIQPAEPATPFVESAPLQPQDAPTSSDAPVTTPTEEPQARLVERNHSEIASKPKPHPEPAPVAPNAGIQKPPPTPIERASPAQHRIYAGVDQAVARECSGKSGWMHSLCKEKVRFGVCSGRWGTTEDCPSYEHKDSPDF